MKRNKHNRRVEEISKKTGKTTSEINLILDMFYSGVVKNLDIEEDLNKVYTEEEFYEKYPAVMIPRIGTFRPSYKKYINIQTKRKKL